MRAVRLFPPGQEHSPDDERKRYYIIERSGGTSSGIKRLNDYSCLSEWINSDYAEDRNYPKEDLILREDGIICRIDPETIEDDLVEFIETEEYIDLALFNECVASLCKHYRCDPERYRIASHAELQDVFERLLERKGVVGRRFGCGCWLLIVGAAVLVIWLAGLVGDWLSS